MDSYYSIIVFPHNNEDITIRHYEDGTFATPVDSSALRGICHFLNHYDDISLYFHSKGDENCGHITEDHYHIVVKNNQVCMVSQHHLYRKLKQQLELNGWGIKSMQIKHIKNFINYLQGFPREFVGAKPGTLLDLQNELYDNSFPVETHNKVGKRKMSDEAVTAKKQRVNKSAENLMDLVEIFRKYNKKCIMGILPLVKKTSPDYAILFNILASGQSNQLEKKAATLVSTTDPRKFYDIFMEGTTDETVLQQYPIPTMTVKETHELYKQWARERGSEIKSPSYFLACMWAISQQKVPKQNTMLLIGAASSGKTFWTDPLLWQTNYIGRTTYDSHFCFADMVTSKATLMNELRFSRDTIEIWKGLGEGKETAVPVKNQNFGIVPSQPIFMTVNVDPWAACAEAYRPVRERSFIFNLNSASAVLYQHKLKNQSAAANPMWLRHVFTILQEKLSELNITELLSKDPTTDPVFLELETELCFQLTEEIPEVSVCDVESVVGEAKDMTEL